MRIIGGRLKGKIITPPPHYQARPTTDFAREGLFGVLGNELDLSDCALLDLFGGTGCISAEFISRGGKEGVCVEMNNKNAAFIRQMLKSLSINTIKVVHCNVFDFIPLCRQQFDIVFADPPYSLHGIETLPDKILCGNILTPHGYFILEHSESYNFESHPNFVKEKKYGNVHFSFFEPISE